MMNTATPRDLLEFEAPDRWGADIRSARLLAHCKKLLAKAQDLEAAASARRSPGLDPAILDCLGATFNSLGTVALLLDQAQGDRLEERDEAAPDPSRLLFAINQNLRFAAQAAELACQVLTEEADRLP
jgi:hypothetical protein